MKTKTAEKLNKIFKPIQQGAFYTALGASVLLAATEMYSPFKKDVPVALEAREMKWGLSRFRSLRMIEDPAYAQKFNDLKAEYDALIETPEYIAQEVILSEGEAKQDKRSTALLLTVLGTGMLGLGTMVTRSNLEDNIRRDYRANN